MWRISLELNHKGGDMKNPTCEGMEGEEARSLPESISTYNILNRYLNFFTSISYFFSNLPQQVFQVYLLSNDQSIDQHLQQPQQVILKCIYVLSYPSIHQQNINFLKIYFLLPVLSLP